MEPQNHPIVKAILSKNKAWYFLISKITQSYSMSLAQIRQTNETESPALSLPTYKQLIDNKSVRNTQWGKKYVFSKWSEETLLPDLVALKTWTHRFRALAL